MRSPETRSTDMDEYERQLCAEFETLRQAIEKAQDDEALSKNLTARLAEIVERLKLVGIDPNTPEPTHRDDPEGAN